MRLSYKNFVCGVGALTLLIISPVHAEVPIAKEKGVPVQVSSSEKVIITFWGASAGTLYSNDLYLETGQTSQLLFNNKTSPLMSTIELGAFHPGTELKLRLHVNNTNTDYFSGVASLNPDGKTHARIESDWKPNEALVSFEDADDFLFNDFSVSITNVNQAKGSLCQTDAKPWIGHDFNIHIPAADYTDAYGKHKTLKLDFDYAPNGKGERLFRLKHSEENHQQEQHR